MPDLETLLRDVKPAPDPAWATKLDARVAAGFPGKRGVSRTDVRATSGKAPRG